MIGALSKSAALVATLLCWNAALAQMELLPPKEIEARNAAMTFAHVRQATMQLLVSECSHLMRHSNPDMQTIAKGWLSRNRRELESATTWLIQYMLYLQRNSASVHQQASTALAQAIGDGVRGNARVFFSRARPDARRCEAAARTFEAPQFDLTNIARNPGYEQFAEFADTLARIRAEPGFSVSAETRSRMDAAEKTPDGFVLIASVEAAEAAKERGDGAERLSIFKYMAGRGDARAAQQVGLMYVNGEQIEKDPVSAYQWFYAAWSLGYADGVNALGTMARDGNGVAVNLSLARAAFYLAKAMARDREAHDRATRNLDRLVSKIKPGETENVACWTLGEIDKALRAPILRFGPVLTGKTIASPNQPLHSVVKELADVDSAAQCQ